MSEEHSENSSGGEPDLSFREAVRRLRPLLAEHKQRLAACLFEKMSPQKGVDSA